MRGVVRIRVPTKGDDGQIVTATAYPAPRSPVRMLLAHGAGAPQGHPLLVAWATGLAERNVEVFTFDFPYAARGSRRPDPRATLEACWVAVATALRDPKRPLVLAGKSMGARMASYVIAAGTVRDVRALVCFGYPLHAAGRTEAPEERTLHLRALGVPTLFVQGTRDTLGTADEVRRETRGLPNVSQHVVAGGDHSLRLRKKDGDQAASDVAMLDAVAAFALGVARPFEA
jgi:predicted alpha/beta-hydrolase family hydrolase